MESDSSTLNQYDAPAPVVLEKSTSVADAFRDDARVVEEDERKLSFRQAVVLYPKAIAWSLFFTLGVLMCSFDTQLIAVLYANPAFQRDFGHLYKSEYIIAARWQTALSMGVPLGQVIGALFAAYPMEWYGLKKTFATCVILTTACVFIQFFARSIAVLLVGELLAGLVLGSYVVIAPAYASEVCPLALRGVLTGCINLAFGTGQLLATVVVAGTSRIDNHWAYSTAFAVQWAWPVVILAGIPFAPESPWWLQRRNRHSAAEASLKRLASPKVDTKQSLDVIIATDRLERDIQAGSTYKDCFNKTNVRQTEIATGVYCIQIFSGTYLVGYGPYFFQLAGLATTSSFVISVIFLVLGIVGNIVAFPLMTRFPHRKIYLVCLAILVTLHLLIAILDCIPSYSTNTTYAWVQAVLACVWNLVYVMSVGPLCFVILTSVSATRVRAKTIAFATSAQAILSIAIGAALPYLLAPDHVGARGKVSFLYAALGSVSWLWAWARLPELKDRTCREVDVLFQRGVKARYFANANIELDVGPGNDDNAGVEYNPGNRSRNDV